MPYDYDPTNTVITVSVADRTEPSFIIEFAEPDQPAHTVMCATWTECLELTAQAVAAQHPDEGYGRGWYETEVAKLMRLVLDANLGEHTFQVLPIHLRYCSYCHTSGHDARDCPDSPEELT